MKRIISLLIAVTILIPCFAGTPDNFRQFYRKYKSDKGVINFTVPGFVVKLATIKQDEETKEILSNISSVKLFIKEENTQNLFNAANQAISNSSYKALLVVKDGSSNVKIAAKMDGDQIKQFIILVEDEESFVAIQVRGKFNEKTLQRIIEEVS
ncbi:MAG: DUF4252 domain-containing protein [Bacteroidales bacterium]|nr:DUF4252 domain-containing protein [Bacteroidales bacterium]MBN2818287.1 DUF4252 domain-containing protein [Bacteroidales bacterium]